MDQSTTLFSTDDHSFIDIFEGLTPAGLGLLRDTLCPALNDADMAACKVYFCEREHRSPTVGELKFLSALSQHRQALPDAATVSEITFSDEESARVWQDICRMRRALAPTAPYPPTLREIAGICGRYLVRSGRPCGHTAPMLDEAAAVAAACRGNTPRAALELDELAGAILPAVADAGSDQDILLLLHPTGEQSFASEISHFFAENKLPGAYPLALVREEGLLHALLETGKGASIDLSTMPACNGNLTALLTAAQQTLLLAAPAGAAMAINDLPLTVIGSRRADGRLVVQDGAEPLLTMHLSFLAACHPMRSVRLNLPRAEEFSTVTPVTVQKNGHLLAAVSAEGRALPALVELVRHTVTEGALLHGATLTSMLTLPDTKEETLAAALPLLLDLHRVSAELSLPSVQHRVQLKSGKPAAISVAIAAPLGAIPPLSLQNEMHFAVKNGDFAALRRIIYEKL